MGCGSSTSTSTTSISHPNSNTKKALIQNNNSHAKQTESLTKHDGSQRATSKHFKTGDRVHVRGYVGTVKFLGPMGLGGSKEDWVGIETDRAFEQGNEGAFQGIQYFACRPKHGLFARPSAVHDYDENLDAINSSWCDVSPQTIIFIQTRIRRFLSRIRLRKLQARSGIEREIDAHVFKTPKDETASINRLSEYLTARWTDEKQKALAIYRWMTLNIAYDAEGFFGKRSKGSCDAESVLRRRVCVCAGYANLFEALCKAANLEVHTVEGYAKGYGYEPKQKFLDGKSNHAWNVLKINGKWYVCEVTWGAGHIGDDMIFTRDPNVNCFLMDPEYAITDHFPLEKRWQLLDEPITKEDFEKLVVPSGDFVSMGIAVVSHPFCVNEIKEDHTEILFYAPSGINLMGHLKYRPSGAKVEPRNMVRILPCGINQIKVTAQFPETGEYMLDISVFMDGKWKFGIRYVFITSKGIGQNMGGFPVLNREFYSMGFDFDCPPSNITTDSGVASVSLRCYSNQYYSVSGSLVKLIGKSEEIKQDQSLCFGEKQDNGFRLKIHLPEAGQYKLNIFAKRFDSGSSIWLCTYFIDSSAGVRPIAGFPHLSDTFSEWNMKLVDTLQNVFSEDGRVSMKLRTPGDIHVTGYLKVFEPEKNLGNHLCFTQKTGEESELFVHTPKPGVYKLVVMGTKEAGAKSEYLCSYKIKSDSGLGQNAGFVRTSNSFKELGLEIQDQIENIVTENGQVKVRVKLRRDLSLLARLNQNNKDLDHQLCFVQRNKGNRTILAHAPAPGFFKLNVFARTSLDSKWEFVFSYFIQSQAAIGYPGFAQISDEFVTWGLELESSFESILSEDGRVAIALTNPERVAIKAWLYNEEQQQQPNSCVSIAELGNNRTVVKCELPSKGLYKLNVFGSQDNSHSNQTFLMKHTIFYS